MLWVVSTGTELKHNSGMGVRKIVMANKII
jgi:hypothetical protein